MIHAAPSAKSGPSILAVGTPTVQPGSTGAPFDLAALVAPPGVAPAGDDALSKTRHFFAATGNPLPHGVERVADDATPLAKPGAKEKAEAPQPASPDVPGSADPLTWLAGMMIVAPTPPPAIDASGDAIVTRMLPTASGTAVECGAPASVDASCLPPPTEAGREAILSAKQRFAAVLVPQESGAAGSPLPVTFDPIEPAAAPPTAAARLTSLFATQAPLPGLPRAEPAEMPAPPPTQASAKDTPVAPTAVVAAPRPDVSAAPVVRIESSSPLAVTTLAAAALAGDAAPISRRDRPGEEADLAPSGLSGLVAAVTHQHAVAPVREGVLDMRSDAWPHAMVERIEALRDAADAMNTRIRLHPDALGTVDVSVRKEGEAVHVNLSAEQAATRQLLADAQPRLTELAEARGIRLIQSGIDTGASGQFAESGQPQRGFTPDQALAPAAAAEPGNAAEDLSTRIA